MKESTLSNIDPSGKMHDPQMVIDHSSSIGGGQAQCGVSSFLKLCDDTVDSKKFEQRNNELLSQTLVWMQSICCSLQFKSWTFYLALKYIQIYFSYMVKLLRNDSIDAVHLKMAAISCLDLA